MGREIVSHLQHIQDTLHLTKARHSRPKTLADVTSQTHTTTLLQRTLRAKNLPHLLFYGPPGTGKTSTVLALSKQLFGPDLFRSRVLELNASDERGISIVRSKIKDFARQQLSAPPAGPAGKAYLEMYPCPPFKIIILDEADSMTQDAQSALRRTMETYSKITRFCLVCNFVTRIIDPLASRCSKFRFKSLDSGDAVARLENIAHAEGVKLDEGVSQALAQSAEGDLRKAITFLQSAARLVNATKISGASKGSKSKKKADTDGGDAMDIDSGPAETISISVAMVQEIAGVIPDAVVGRLIGAIKPPAGSKPKPGAGHAAITSAMTDITADGWPATQLLSQLHQTLVMDETVSDRAKVGMMAVFGETDKRLLDGADEELTMLDCAMRSHAILVAKG